MKMKIPTGKPVILDFHAQSLLNGPQFMLRQVQISVKILVLLPIGERASSKHVVNV